MPFGIHPIWLLLLLVIVLIIFGPGKLPQLGGALGRSIREFQKSKEEIVQETQQQASASEATATPPAVTKTDSKS
jgi:sec-independent protein translocase protein TatA